mgnify:CR=1 FL=1
MTVLTDADQSTSLNSIMERLRQREFNAIFSARPTKGLKQL